MKKGMILFVTEGREQLNEWQDLRRERKQLGVDAVCLATSETEIAYGWWQMLARGMQEISCVRAVYDEMQCVLQTRGVPLRLCG